MLYIRFSEVATPLKDATHRPEFGVLKYRILACHDKVVECHGCVNERVHTGTHEYAGKQCIKGMFAATRVRMVWIH